jgi:hypothetical protein
MAATYMLKLERIQFRCLRIALGLMQSTDVQTSPSTVGCGAVEAEFYKGGSGDYDLEPVRSFYYYDVGI